MTWITAELLFIRILIDYMQQTELGRQCGIMPFISHMFHGNQVRHSNSFQWRIHQGDRGTCTPDFKPSGAVMQKSPHNNY